MLKMVMVRYYTANNPMHSTKIKKSSFLHKISVFLITQLENFFYWYGITIAKRPYHFILLCILVTFLCSFGFANFKTEERPFKLWIPQDSEFLDSMHWQAENYPQKFRTHMLLFEAENVLDKKILLGILTAHKLLSNTKTLNSTWKSVCAKIPIIPDNLFFRRKRSAGNKKSFNGHSSQRFKRNLPWWSSLLSRDDICEMESVLQYECLESSLLKIWKYDEDVVKRLSQDDIITDVNDAVSNPMFGAGFNITKFLGAIRRNSEGLIVGAKTMRHIFISEIDKSEVALGNSVSDKWTGMEVDKNGFEWENVLTSRLLNYSKETEGYHLYFMTASSFSLITESTIQGDITYFAIGFFVVFMYVQFMLGNLNLVEQRPILSLVGITCVFFSIVISNGICSFLGIMYGPVNNALPFLLLGLGVDDMFVILQSFNNLSSKENECDLTMRIGLALKHAGVSITITSMTDVVAFAIGATTILPALRSFCLYAAVGITSVYLLQATFFVAWLSLDQKRLEESRQGLFWCIKFDNYTPNECSQRNLCQLFFKKYYSKFIQKPIVKVLILLLAFGFFGVSAWGLHNLEQEFDPIWFLPQSTYLYKFFDKLKTYFTSDGMEANVFFGNISLSEMPKLANLSNDLRNNPYVGRVDSWYDDFEIFWNGLGKDPREMAANETVFLDGLSEFLFSPSGFKYRIKNFVFPGNLSCKEAAPPITSFSIDFQYKVITGSVNKINAMETVKQLVRETNFSGYAQPWSLLYSGWETDKVIEIELYRNMGLALVVIGIMMLALIASFRTSFYVLVCVLMTLVDVGGLMYWWGLTIDTVSCIDLVLAIGLCVDYAAHIGHTFMTEEGTKDQRVEETLTKIGPAVLYGGISNVLAFILLAGSDSHVFKTFFKIFFGVSLYGLFHGLVFLPVVLSLIGPPSYGSARDNPLKNTVELPAKELEVLTAVESNRNMPTDEVDHISLNGDLEQLRYCRETMIV